VDRALAKRPDDRFASAEDMAAAFRALSETNTGTTPPPREAGENHETIVVLSSRGQTSLPSGASLQSIGDFEGVDESSLSTIERSLARHIGPMARFHLRRAMQDTHSPDELCRLLGQLVPQEDLRNQFVDDAIKIITARQDQSMGAAKAAERGSGASAVGSIPGQPRPAVEAIESVTHALTQTMGPMARHLVTNALARASTLDELQALCMELIDNVDERRRFQNLLADRRHPGSLPVSVRDLSGDQA
jgi:serine/threonine-protein kinase